MEQERVPTNPRDSLLFWKASLDAYQKSAESWMKDAKMIEERFSLEKQELGTRKSKAKKPIFNLLWSNIQTLKPSVFSRVPRIVAERRNKDPDAVGRAAAEVIERAVEFETETSGLEDSMNQVVLDNLLVGRGIPWVVFESDIIKMRTEVSLDVDGLYRDRYGAEVQADQVMPEGERWIIEEERVANERTIIDYVYWMDFAHSQARSWAEIERNGWVARRTMLTRDEGVARFGKIFRQVPLAGENRTASIMASDKEKVKEDLKMAEVWEIWDMRSRQRMFLSKDFDQWIEKTKDPYGLEKFFPCPRPAFATLTNKSLFPIPDYKMYVDLADELDTISWRIQRLTEALRLVGVYDASAEGLAEVLQGSNDGKMVPVSNMAALLGKSAPGSSSLGGMVKWLPMEFVVNTLSGLYAAREQVKSTIYEVSGISDAARGKTDPREKATATRIKTSFTTQRLDQRRRAVERVSRDVLRIQAEMMVELFQPATLRDKAGFDMMPEVAEMEETQKEQLWASVADLLKNEKMRQTRIDIETDSTIEMNAELMQKERTEFLNAAGTYLTQMAPMMMQVPEMTPLLGEMMMFTIRGFRAGRSMESKFEEFLQKFEEKQTQAKEQPDQPSPEEMKAQAEMETLKMRMQVEQAKAQIELQRLQLKAQAEQVKMQSEAQQDVVELQREQARMESDLARSELELQMMVMDLQHKEQKMALEASVL